MGPGKKTRKRDRLRRFAAAPVLLVSLALPAAPATAAAETTVVRVDSTQLRLTGLPGSPSEIELSYRTAAEAGFGGVSDRFVIKDAGGVQAVNPDCVSVDASTVSCDATFVRGISAFLGDGDDVLVVAAGKANGVPRRFPTELHGGAGADTIRGGRGEDRILGGKGRDVIAGWSGDDFLAGGPGADGVIGFGGDDTLFGDGGRDALFGQKGHDFMFGGKQNDVLLARDGIRDPKLSCGPGKHQRALTDRRDPPTSNCKGG
jgi:RTX calcium-binding nonapeptide repeat (4 copies)